MSETPESYSNKKPARSKGTIFLVIGIVFFIIMLIPEPTDLAPVVGWIDELLEGGISFTSLMAFAYKYFKNKKLERAEREQSKTTIDIKESK